MNIITKQVFIEKKEFSDFYGMSFFDLDIIQTWKKCQNEIIKLNLNDDLSPKYIDLNYREIFFFILNRIIGPLCKEKRTECYSLIQENFNANDRKSVLVGAHINVLNKETRETFKVFYPFDMYEMGHIHNMCIIGKTLGYCMLDINIKEIFRKLELDKTLLRFNK